MQVYRRAPIGSRSAVAEAYEAVKEFLRDNRDVIEDGSHHGFEFDEEGDNKMNKPRIGWRVAVKCAVKGTDKTVTKYGVVDAVVDASDRPFRVSVVGDNGEHWQECAPECLKVVDVDVLIRRLESAVIREGKAEHEYLSSRKLEQLSKATTAAREELVAEISRRTAARL